MKNVHDSAINSTVKKTPATITRVSTPDDMPKSYGCELSVYRTGMLLKDVGDECDEILDVLRVEYKMSEFAVDKMIDEMIEQNWTVERFKASFKHVFNNHIYATAPRPAQFLAFDKKIKFNTYEEICTQSKHYTSCYYGIPEPLYVTHEEKKEFNIPDWNEKYRTKAKIKVLDPESGEVIYSNY